MPMLQLSRMTAGGVDMQAAESFVTKAAQSRVHKIIWCLGTRHRSKRGRRVTRNAAQQQLSAETPPGISSLTPPVPTPHMAAQEPLQCTQKICFALLLKTDNYARGTRLFSIPKITS